MLTLDANSTLSIQRMLMHLSSNHVTLLLGKFHPPWTFPPIGLRSLGELTLGISL